MNKILMNIRFKHGLMAPIQLEASSQEEAVKMGLVEYRRNCTIMDFSKVTDVISCVELPKDVA